MLKLFLKVCLTAVQVRLIRLNGKPLDDEKYSKKDEHEKKVSQVVVNFCGCIVGNIVNLHVKLKSTSLIEPLELFTPPSLRNFRSWDHHHLWLLQHHQNQHCKNHHYRWRDHHYLIIQLLNPIFHLFKLLLNSSYSQFLHLVWHQQYCQPNRSLTEELDVKPTHWFFLKSEM